MFAQFTKRTFEIVRPAMTAVLSASLVLTASAGLAGCSRGPATIKIGAAGPFTGSLSKIGQDSLNAINMAVDEFNASGRLKGVKVEVVVADDGAEPAKATLAAEKLAADKNVVGVIGPMNSGAVNSSLPVYERAGLAIISQSATNPSLTEGGYKVMHRVCPRDDQQGPAAAKFIVDQVKAKKVYIIDDKSTYGQGLADQVAATFAKLGSVTVDRGQIAADDKEFSPILGRVKAFGADLVFLAIPDPAQGAMIAKQMRALGITAGVMGGDGLYEPDQFAKAGGAALEGAYVTSITPSLKDVPAAKDFVTRFEGKYGSMSIFAGQSYEATNILLKAIADAAAAKGGKVTRADVLPLVHGTVNYMGILGQPIGFNDKGDLSGGSIFIFQVKNGAFNFVGRAGD
ncbi:MAG TPA: branched-chain amino acid ABC transporter substrate-binding protein [Bacillota bacterium]|jgi:branched-chain amino acid transport system substrate-binding protein